MSGADFIVGLLTIVTGLAICDMIVSLHGLLINRRHVKWDWLALVSAAYVVLAIINTWRMTYVAFQDAVKGPAIWVFLLILTQNVGLYLAARTALPDKVDFGEAFDLASYYDLIDRYLWSAVLTANAAYIVLSILGLITRGMLLYQNVFIQVLIGIPLILALVIWPNRTLHRVGVPMLLVWQCIRTLPGTVLIA
jgi:hypothetical protein